MKNKHLGLWAFLVLNLIVFATLEFALRKGLIWRKPGEYEFSKSVDYFEADAKNTEILFIGDCQIFYGVDPKTIQTDLRIHNFSFPAEPVGASVVKLRYYLNHGWLPKLKTVVMGLTAGRLLEESSDIRIDINGYERYYEGWEIASWSKLKFVQQKLFHYCRSCQLHQYLTKVKFDVPLHEVLEPSGFSRREYTLHDGELAEHLKEISIESAFKKPLDRKTVYLKQLRQMLDERGIQLVFTTLPSSSLLYKEAKLLPEDFDRDRFSGFQGYFKEELDGVPYWDFSQRKDFQAADYSDYGHLNLKGSAKMGKLFMSVFAKAPGATELRMLPNGVR